MGRRLVIGVLAACALVGPAAHAQDEIAKPHDTTPPRVLSDEEALAHVNEVRGRMGLPALAWDPVMSAGCRKHGEYTALNGGDLSHSEDPGSPGYSPEGHAAAQTSGLNPGPLPFPPDGVYDVSAPVHNMIAFKPGATTLHRGYAAGFDCIGTGPRALAPPDGKVYLWPPSRGAPIPQEASFYEIGPDLRDLIGKRSGPNGPAFYVLGKPVNEPGSCIVEQLVELTDAAGRNVPLGLADESDDDLIFGGAFAIPMDALRPGTGYVLRATYVRRDGCRSSGRAQRISAAAAYCTTGGPCTPPAIAPDTPGVTGPRVAAMRVHGKVPRLVRGHAHRVRVSLRGHGRVELRGRLVNRGTITLGPVDLTPGEAAVAELLVDRAESRRLVRRGGGRLVVTAGTKTLTIKLTPKRRR